MSVSNEVFWREEADRRKRIRKWSVIIVGGLPGLLAVAWAIVTQPLLVDLPIRNDLPAIDTSRLELHVRTIVEKMLPRDAGHPQNLDRTATYIRQEFAVAHGEVAEQPFAVEGKAYRNVIASYGPETRERIVVGAHYDTAGEQPGSDDNASGVAGLLELARLLGNKAPFLRVDLVAYTLEEPEYFHTDSMGSAVHAQGLRRQNAEVRLMISLEMIGYFSDATGSQGLPSSLIRPFYPTRGDFIAVVSKLDQGRVVRRVKKAMRTASALPVHSLNAPTFVPGIEFSDHLNYWNAGYDAVMITDTAFFRNTRYHTIDDTPDSLDYRRMAMVVQGVYSAIFEIAQK